MKVSFITTVFNEENSISVFLDSLFSQTVLPHEIIIVDAGSTDATVHIAEEKIQEFKKFNKKISIKIFVKKGNRSIGRNSAIEVATGDIIACSDAGCTLNKDWLKLITTPFNNNTIDVVSGFYKPIANTVFEKCLASYMCIMPDKVNPATFLPSSRSIAFKKSAWEKIQGYPEKLDTCEDLVFARNLQKAGYEFFFEKNATVYWPQRKNFVEAFDQFFTYAKGDGQALYFRPQTPLLFGRYLLASLILLLGIVIQDTVFLLGLSILFLFYLIWAIMKNFRYIKKIKALFLLPLLQLTADAAVLSGTLFGILKKLLGENNMGYYRDTVRGVGWIGSLRVFTRIISFARTAIIARILSPEQFGLFGIASLALILIEILTETGINVFLVQEKEKIEKYISTAWIVSIARGILIFLTLIILAPVIGDFYNSPNAVILLLIVSLVPLIRGFINPAIAVFQKELQFNKEFYFRSSIFLVESVVAVVLVLKTNTPEGLVWGLVAGAIYEVIVSFIIIRPIPKFSFNFILMKNVISRGKWVTFSGIFSYLFHNGDNIVIGKMKGVGALGIYDMAYRISMLPITEVADVVAKVTFPVYVKIAHDKKRLQKAFLKSLLVVSALCLPIGIVFIIFPREIILILLGNKWLEAAQVLQVLAVFGVVRAISGVSSSVFFAVQKQKYTTVITLVSFMTLAISIVPFVNMFGLIGAGLAAVLGSLTAVPFIIYYTIKVFKIK